MRRKSIAFAALALALVGCDVDRALSDPIRDAAADAAPDLAPVCEGSPPFPGVQCGFPGGRCCAGEGMDRCPFAFGGELACIAGCCASTSTTDGG